MQAIVLVGGEGTRLRPLTYGTPKPMVPIHNVPFLARTMVRLYDAGIRDIILPSGYMPQAISDYFGDGSRLGLNITYVIEEEPLGTAGALKNVESHITGPFFVLNGDILTSLDLRAMIEYHEEKRGLGVLHLIHAEDPSAFGCVVHDENGRISQFIEKPPKGTEPTNEVNAGTYLLEREVLRLIPPGRKVSIERETFPAILRQAQDDKGGVPRQAQDDKGGVPRQPRDDRGLYAFTTDDYWMDLGKPEHYLAAHRDILSGVMPLKLEPGITGNGASGVRANIVPPVHIDPGVTMAISATVGPNVALGPGCTIGERAIVRDSVLWDDVRVGADAVIEESIIASRARIGERARIGRGSVIGHDAVIDPDIDVGENARIGGAAAATS